MSLYFTLLLARLLDKSSCLALARSLQVSFLKRSPVLSLGGLCDPAPDASHDGKKVNTGSSVSPVELKCSSHIFVCNYKFCAILVKQPQKNELSCRESCLTIPLNDFNSLWVILSGNLFAILHHTVLSAIKVLL